MQKAQNSNKRRNGSLQVQASICDFCGSCVAVCPVDCINLSETQIAINMALCNMCLNCVKVCPLHIISEVEI